MRKAHIKYFFFYYFVLILNEFIFPQRFLDLYGWRWLLACSKGDWICLLNLLVGAESHIIPF